MKTKNLIYIALGLMLFATQACQDKFLELEPRTNSLEGNAYLTEDDAFLALVTAYDAISHQEVLNFQPYRSDIYSDDTYCAGEPPSGGMTSRWMDMELSQLDAESGSSSEVWGRCYKGIYRCNQFLNKSPGIAWVTPGLQARMEAEMYFLKSYYYWDLVRHFGWVPLVKDLITATDAQGLVQSEPQEVFAYIAENLLKAEANLPEIVSADDYGRATKAAAQVLMARIYMYYHGDVVQNHLGVSGDWTDGVTIIDENMVKTKLTQVIDNGNYILLADYAEVHSWDYQNNAESIFEIQYSEKSKYSSFSTTEYNNGNTICHISGPRNPKGDSTMISGWSFGMLSWTLINEFETGDPRYEATVYDASIHLTSYTPGFHDTGYFNRKYVGRQKYRSTEALDVHNYPKNHIDMRLAEVYLLLAELYLDDDNALATTYLNEVRTRSMGDAAALASITIDNLRHEKRVEFACEGLRYWDLLRWGLDYAQTVIEASYIPDPSYPAPDEFIGFHFNPAHLGMLPIPADEIRNSNEGVTEQKIDFYK